MNREQPPVYRRIKGRNMMIRSEAAPAAFQSKGRGHIHLKGPFSQPFRSLFAAFLHDLQQSRTPCSRREHPYNQAFVYTRLSRTHTSGRFLYFSA